MEGTLSETQQQFSYLFHHYLAEWRPWANYLAALGLSLLINLFNKHYLNTDLQEHNFAQLLKGGN